jgi:hypothetical protein
MRWRGITCPVKETMRSMVMGIIHPSTHPVQVIGITDSEDARTTFDVQLEEGFAKCKLCF